MESKIEIIKKLIKEQRAKDTSRLNQISVWVLVYGIITIIVSFPLISGSIWLSFANLMIDLLSGTFTSLRPDTFMYYVLVFLIIFSLPTAKPTLRPASERLFEKV